MKATMKNAGFCSLHQNEIPQLPGLPIPQPKQEPSKTSTLELDLYWQALLIVIELVKN